MAEIPGARQLSQITIPGTHNSGARYDSAYWSGTAKTQDFSIGDQLGFGVRSLDIRCRHINDMFAIHHGEVYQNLYFGDVLNQVYSFLDANPSECVIMVVKEEYTPDGNTRSFEDTFLDYVAKNPGKWWMESNVPTLGAVRGRIVLLRRFTGSVGISINAGFLRWYDDYEVRDNAVKWNQVLAGLGAASAETDPNILCFNHSSGYYPGWFGIPDIPRVSNYINPRIADYFANAAPGHYGCLIMDFADATRSQAIYSANVTLPAPPTGLTATAGNAKVLLTWTASSGATGYRVKRSTTNGGPYAQIGSTTAATSYLDTTAGNGTPYYYVVSADNAAGDSANTAQAGATPASPLPPPPGTAVYYSFNDSANLGHDDSGNGQHLRAATGTPQQAASGASGGALYLDGTTTLGTVSGSFPTGVPTGASPYTVACFVKADPASPTGGGWIGYGTNGSALLSNNFRLNGYGGVWNYWYYVDLGATVPDAGDFRTAWHSVVGTWDGSTRRIYIDGRLASSDTPAAPNIGTTSFIVGRTLNDSNLKGWIDDLLIAGRAWTAGEVTAYHLGAFGPGPASYGSWASDNSASPDPREDSNHNGVPNGVEFFMGGTAASPAALPDLVNTADTWTWTIPYDPNAAANYYFQVSTSLQSWTPLSPAIRPSRF